MKNPDNSILERARDLWGGTISHPWLKGAVIAGSPADMFLTMGGGVSVQPMDGTPKRDLQTFVRMSLGLTNSSAPTAANDNAPVDLWAEREKPSLPRGVLPAVIDDFAFDMAEQMGADVGGLAMAAITVCAAAIPDAITLQVKKHDTGWREAARLWTAVVGAPSTKKSPIISTAARPLRAVDDGLVRSYIDALGQWGALEKAQQREKPKPRQARARIEDATIEATQEVLKDNPDGVLLIRDELSAWFGSMEKYGSSKASMADRSFWLESFNGGSYAINRVGRGVCLIPNLSISLLGGIQPEPMRRIANDMHDDGLLQRFLPVVLSPAGVGHDRAVGPSVGTYGDTVRRLRRMSAPGLGGVGRLVYSEDAQAIRVEMEERHHAMVRAWEEINRKFAGHLGKYDSFFNRLCIVFHCIEANSDVAPNEISADVARRVASFLHDFIFRHGLAFYSNILGLTDDHDALLATAGYILSRPTMKVISARDVRRGDRIMRTLDTRQAEAILERLDSLGWLTAKPRERNETSTHYQVSPLVRELFEDRAEVELERRARVRATIAQSSGRRTSGDK
ncbi:DUF3987 domain-containing protein [Pelagibacterium lentulum]|uniref:DUF3987 domain-containing protein n=1 Tax=Pelagibacterium lentulum TaxID=2029865 RepID=A0A916RA00_9HYPH|nr:DUF3987 domain-containing protein [Pelagibacterium lentulum]GGA47330.1 hypothetical protein GCM10011499_16410 [Pelagibacterium lentulum]